VCVCVCVCVCVHSSVAFGQTLLWLGSDFFFTHVCGGCGWIYDNE